MPAAFVVDNNNVSIPSESTGRKLCDAHLRLGWLNNLDRKQGLVYKISIFFSNSF